MQPLSDKMIGLLNSQASKELGNEILYRHIASYANQRGLKGIDKYFTEQADGERGHSEWLRDLLKDANAQLALDVIPAKPFQFGSCEEISQLYVEAEAATTDSLEAIYAVAMQENDIGTQDLLQKMLREQIEEEGSADRIANLVSLSHGNLIELDLALR